MAGRKRPKGLVQRHHGFSVLIMVLWVSVSVVNCPTELKQSLESVYHPIIISLLSKWILFISGLNSPYDSAKTVYSSWPQPPPSLFLFPPPPSIFVYSQRLATSTSSSLDQIRSRSRFLPQHHSNNLWIHSVSTINLSEADKGWRIGQGCSVSFDTLSLSPHKYLTSRFSFLVFLWLISSSTMSFPEDMVIISICRVSTFFQVSFPRLYHFLSLAGMLACSCCSEQTESRAVAEIKFLAQGLFRRELKVEGRSCGGSLTFHLQFRLPKPQPNR